MAIKIIRNKHDYAEALKSIEISMAASPRKGSAQAEELEVLAVLVDEYEKHRFIVGNPDPIEAIRFRMEQANLAPRDLIPYLGSRSKVSEVLSGKRSLTVDMIRALHNHLSIPAEVLVQESNQGASFGDAIDWVRFPVAEMATRGYFKGIASYKVGANSDELTENAEQLVKSFMGSVGIASPMSLPVLFKKTPLHLRSGRQMDRHGLAAWTIQVLRIAGEKIPPVAYEQKVLTDDFLNKVARLSHLDDGPLLAQDLLFEHGISMVIEPHMPRTHLDGAAVAIWGDRPVIGLTIRHDRVDNFWFCLLHELSHLQLHLTGSPEQFYDDLDVGSDDPREKQADDKAGETLIPQAAWLRSPARLAPSPQAAQRLADQLQIHPAVVAGRIRHHNKSFRLLNTMIGQGEVRRLFPNVSWPNT